MRTRTFLPRPEYPRPERQRGFVQGEDWLNLNGPWEFRFDYHRQGVDEQWYLPDQGRWSEQIIVPFCWESLAAWGEADAASNDHYFSLRVYLNPVEVNRSNYRDAARYEVGWYRRRVQIPTTEAWAQKRVILTIGAADHYTEAWCNGHFLGRHEGGFIPFEFDLTDALETDSNGERIANLVFRVEDPMNNREQLVGKQWGWYSSASGIWQTVFIEPRAESYIERFEITSDLEKKSAHLKVFTRGGHSVALRIQNPQDECFTDCLVVENGYAEGSVYLDPVFLWTPNFPHLYQLTLTLLDGTSRDVVHSYFGMRTLSAEAAAVAGAPATLCLNQQPIYLRGALYQSYHAEGVYTAGDAHALRDDIAYAKRVGFDLLRIHIKVDDPLLLYYADTLGILIMADFPNFGEGGDTPLGRQRYEATMRSAIQRDFNHPSIVAWCLFNETWGFGGQVEFIKLINPGSVKNLPPPSGPSDHLVGAESYRWIEQMWKLAKSLDSTRLVEDMSVVAWEHLIYYGHGATDINSWHFYSNNYKKARAHIEDVVRETYAGSSYNYVPGFQQSNQPLINSEYGGVGALDGDRDASWSFKFLTNELRRHGNISAYIYTELHDVEWERNGFLNYDRSPKDFGYDPTIVNHGDVLAIDAPPIDRHSPGQEVSVEVFSSHYSRRQLGKVYLQWRVVGVDSLGWMHGEIAGGGKEIAFPQFQVELAERVQWKMPECTMLCTLWVNASTADGAVVARNYVQFFVDGGSPNRELREQSLIMRANPGEWQHAEWTGGSNSTIEAADSGACFGRGTGDFEWILDSPPEEPHPIVQIRVLCEASSRREDFPQTDTSVHPSTLRITLNGVRVYDGMLPNHPHDTRGALSYLHGDRGAYGYMAHATIEGELLKAVLAGQSDGRWILQCGVPEDAEFKGGLTVYGADCGRYPIPPTLVVEYGAPPVS